MSDNFTFEAGMEELEALVARMEAGDMPLEESFQAYKRAMKLYKLLSAKLDEGDARIRELTETGDIDITREVTG